MRRPFGPLGVCGARESRGAVKAAGAVRKLIGAGHQRLRSPNCSGVRGERLSHLFSPCCFAWSETDRSASASSAREREWTESTWRERRSQLTRKGRTTQTTGRGGSARSERWRRNCWRAVIGASRETVVLEKGAPVFAGTNREFGRSSSRREFQQPPFQRTSTLRRDRWPTKKRCSKRRTR